MLHRVPRGEICGLNTAGPDQRALTLVMYLYQTGFLTGDLGYASAVGWVLALTLGSIAIIHRRMSRRREDS
jgi:ABC-type sugar transport system permease subunit